MRGSRRTLGWRRRVGRVRTEDGRGGVVAPLARGQGEGRSVAPGPRSSRGRRLPCRKRGPGGRGLQRPSIPPPPLRSVADRGLRLSPPQRRGAGGVSSTVRRKARLQPPTFSHACPPSVPCKGAPVRAARPSLLLQPRFLPAWTEGSLGIAACPSWGPDSLSPPPFSLAEAPSRCPAGKNRTWPPSWLTSCCPLPVCIRPSGPSRSTGELQPGFSSRPLGPSWKPSPLGPSGKGPGSQTTPGLARWWGCRCWPLASTG